MTAAPKEQPKTSEAMANELTWYDALLLYGLGWAPAARNTKDMDSRRGFPQAEYPTSIPGNGGPCDQDFREEI